MTSPKRSKQLTDLQCDLVIRLCRGEGYLRPRKNHTGRDGYMLYVGQQVPKRWYSDKTARPVTSLLKKDSSGRLTLNFNLVRQLDGRGYIKKAYKKTRSTKVTYA